MESCEGHERGTTNMLWKEIISCSDIRKMQELVELEFSDNQWTSFRYMELGGKEFLVERM